MIPEGPQQDVTFPFIDEGDQTYGAWGWDLLLTFALMALLMVVPYAWATGTTYSPDLFIFEEVICGLFLFDFLYAGWRCGWRRMWRRKSLWQLVGVLPFYGTFAPLLSDASYSSLLLWSHLGLSLLLLRRWQWHREKKDFGNVARLSLVLGGLVLAIHTIACGWLLVAPHPSADAATNYNHALYWTVTTLTTVGYGDITPQSNLTRVFAIVVMLLGVGFYGLIIGQVSRYMMAADQRKEQAKGRMEALAAFCRHYDVPTTLHKEAVHVLRHVTAQRLLDEERTVLSQLPRALRDEIELYMHIKPLSLVGLFRGCSHQCLVDAASLLERQEYAPFQSVMQHGEDATSMFVVDYGKVLIHHGSAKIAELGAGECLGEMALVMDTKRTADATALAHTTLLRLSKENFSVLMANHPELKHNVKRLVNERKRAS